MSTSIRLHALPITERPQVTKSEVPTESVAKINCILHSDHLPVHQHLEMRVNGVLQQGVPEGDHQIVFSWQLMKASDEIRINLLKRGVITKYWQGCWNERDAILYMGTLAVQVFFDGKPQPGVSAIGGLTSAATLAAMHPSFEAVNGKSPHDPLPEATVSVPDEPSEHQMGIIVHDLFVLAQPHPYQERSDDASADVTGENARYSNEQEEETEDDLGEERYQGTDHGFEEDLVDEQEDEADEEFEEEIVDEGEDERMEKQEGEPDDEIEEERADTREDESNNEITGNESLETRDDPHPSVPHATSIGTRIAAFHANAQHIEETLAALQNLIAAMPPKTVLIDLRQHSHAKKRRQEPGGLSKDHLRAVFGGTYWDRGWAIQTTYRSVPTSDSSSGWRREVAHPESHPDGILSLVRFLQEGYSMIVMDQMAAYEESPRRGVIEELCQRLPDLVVGPLG